MNYIYIVITFARLIKAYCVFISFQMWDRLVVETNRYADQQRTARPPPPLLRDGEKPRKQAGLRWPMLQHGDFALATETPPRESDKVVVGDQLQCRHVARSFQPALEIRPPARQHCAGSSWGEDLEVAMVL